jgi:hypothetical protein
MHRALIVPEARRTTRLLNPRRLVILPEACAIFFYRGDPSDSTVILSTNGRSARASCLTGGPSGDASGRRLRVTQLFVPTALFLPSGKSAHACASARE